MPEVLRVADLQPRTSRDARLQVARQPGPLSSESGRFGRPEAVRKNAAHPPCSDVFLASARTASQFAVPPFPGLRRLASGADQRLWISITGNSSGEA